MIPSPPQTWVVIAVALFLLFVFFFSILTICLNLFSGIYILCGRWLLMSLVFLSFFLSFFLYILVSISMLEFFWVTVCQYTWVVIRWLLRDCAQTYWMSKDSSLHQEICLWLGSSFKIQVRIEVRLVLTSFTFQPAFLSLSCGHTGLCVCVCVCVWLHIKPDLRIAKVLSVLFWVCIWPCAYAQPSRFWLKYVGTYQGH